MRNPSKLFMAQTVAQRDYAWDSLPEADDPKVLEALKLPDFELMAEYDKAVKCISAMRWNTMTLGIRPRRRQ